ncbi:heterokaryon incompatibility protein-domain-containing protein [Apodospora peruviana]|uniref:Heterokaryon incompatibility protein-domain-containing protein n=1 Tax=Apodospora peruviana TaxID=516989 RepID=A0AAE0HUV5_9PEZI|nr:heterokaryon incompatibility protein-domain-containing protein [Apodospora peruviana]
MIYGNHSFQYKMQPLPNPRYIRLIDLEQGAEADLLSISIQVHELESAPPYDALSYTWGDPSSPPVELTMSTADEDVLCHGKPLTVKPNLASALRALRTPSPTPGKLGIPRQELIWIDAICINQEDLVERASQVSMMGEVYGRAETVIVWVGPEDASTDDAMRILETLATVPENTVSAARDSLPLDIRNPGVYSQQLGIEPVQLHEWLGWIALVERNYFRRAWIIQEVVKAQQLVFLCGPRVFAWDAFSAAYSFLQNTRWLEILTPSYILTYLSPAEIPDRYHRFLDPGRHSIEDSAMVVRFARHYLSEVGMSIGLVECLRLFRSSLCSDARDKIFSILSIIDKDSPELKVCPDVRHVDYTIPVPELYLKVAWSSIQATNDLAILKHKEQEVQTKVQGLPSWVPDWTTPHNHTSLDSDDSINHWDASAGLQFHLPPSLGAHQLQVQGICIGSISSLSADSTSVVDFWASSAPLVAGMAATYTSRFDQSVTSRLELLAMTLWRDQFCSLNLSPVQVHSLTISYILWQLHLCCIQSTLAEDDILLEPRPRDQWNWQRKVRENSDNWQPMPLFRPLLALLDEEPTLSPVIVDRDLVLALAEQLVETNQAEMTVDTGIPRTLDDNHAASSAELTNNTSVTVSGEELARYINVGLAHRKIARNDDLGLSLVPECTRPGDEIWVLAGAKTPFILRTGTGSQGSSYRLVGEAFVHHVMKGEVVRGGEVVQDVLIE